MNAQEMLNKEYEKLCLSLGDLTYKRKAIDAQIKAIEASIKALDAAVPQVKEVEKLLKKAQLAEDNAQPVQD